jgi:hypothetical protein
MGNKPSVQEIGPAQAGIAQDSWYQTFNGNSCPPMKAIGNANKGEYGPIYEYFVPFEMIYLVRSNWYGVYNGISEVETQTDLVAEYVRRRKQLDAGFEQARDTVITGLPALLANPQGAQQNLIKAWADVQNYHTQMYASIDTRGYDFMTLGKQIGYHDLYLWVYQQAKVFDATKPATLTIPAISSSGPTRVFNFTPAPKADESTDPGQDGKDPNKNNGTPGNKPSLFDQYWWMIPVAGGGILCFFVAYKLST